MTCPRCGAAAAETQEYCLACGLRLPGRGRFGPVPLRQRRLVLPLLLTLAAAAGGAVAAIAATRDDAAAPPPIVATGGSVTIATPDTGPRLAVWPVGTDAWTIVLESFPKGTGAARADAESLATAARGRGLPRVGILDSGRFASMHPGYWIVFTGVYDTQPDANGALAQARAVVKTARVQRVAA